MDDFYYKICFTKKKQFGANNSHINILGHFYRKQKKISVNEMT